MTPSKPIEIDGKVYDKYTMSLIVSEYYEDAGNDNASIVLNLVPTRIGADGIETLPEYAKNIRIGSVSQADEATLKTIEAIKSILQNYINEEGL
jgi:hypothetical protein